MFLGIDLGTSSLKAVVIDSQHQVRATAEAPLEVNHPKTNWSEQDPAHWEHALALVCADLNSQTQLQQVERIGLTGQMHGATCLDAKGHVIRPCILWNDGRSGEECIALNRLGDGFTQYSGNLAMPGFTAPKLMWLKKHEADTYQQIRHVLLPKDYLRFVLTNELSTDPSDASGTLWMNPRTRQWDDALIEMTDGNRDWLADVIEGPDETGMVSSEASRKYGLPRVPVVAGGGDNACGALALGISSPGQTFISLGTSGVFFTVSENHQACPEKTVHAFAHALPNTWHQMTVTLSAAHSLNWLSGITGQSVADMVSRVSVSNQTETDVQFLPYLNGERSPHNDPDARGVFLNLSSATTVDDLCLAVMEGVAFSFCDGLAALREAGATIESTLSIGGGTRSKYWLQMMANALEIIVETSDSAVVGPSLGAARLAMTDQNAAYPNEHITDRLLPVTARADYFQSKLRNYRQAYLALRQIRG